MPERVGAATEVSGARVSLPEWLRISLRFAQQRPLGHQQRPRAPQFEPDAHLGIDAAAIHIHGHVAQCLPGPLLHPGRGHGAGGRRQQQARRRHRPQPAPVQSASVAQQHRQQPGWQPRGRKLLELQPYH